MRTEELKEHIINEKASLIEALEQLNSLSGKAMTLFVVNTDGKLVGTLTDGDIRRSLITKKRDWNNSFGNYAHLFPIPASRKNRPF